MCLKNELLFLLTFIIAIGFSQGNIATSEILLDENNLKSFVKFRDDNKYATDSISEISVLVELNNRNTAIGYKKEREYKDDLGFTHKVYQQYYNDILVVGASYVVHTVENDIKYINGNAANISGISIQPKVLENDVLRIVKNDIKLDTGTKIIIENKGLVICKDYLLGGKDYNLAYKILVLENSMPIYKYYYVDANSLKILAIQDLMCFVNSNGSVQTSYSGTQNITADSYNNQYRLQENRQGVNIITKNCQNNTPGLDQFTIEVIDNDNNWTISEHPIDKQAHDAHWASEKIFDYWKTVHNRNSIDNNGLRMRSYIHFNTNYNNAAWAPHPDILSAYYGDGDGVTYSSFNTLDICAHEFGHAITQYTANFNTLTYESEGLYEGFSDIWSAAIEDWATPNSPTKNKWLMGEENTLTPPYFERRMDIPNSINYADTYGGSHWSSTVSYRKSTVLSYWFYLLGEGGDCITTNDFGNNIYVGSIGMNKAAKIAYRTLQLLNSSADFNMARTMSIQATEELFGINSSELISVKNAWYAVGLGSQSSIPYPSNSIPALAVSGSGSICSGSQIYAINNLPPGATVVWSRTPTNTTTLTQLNNVATLTKTGNGSVQITATISINCGTSFTYITIKNINVGLPYFSWTIPTETQAGASSVDEFECSDVSNPMCYSAGSNGQKNWSTSSLSNYTSASWSKVWSIPSSGYGIIWSGTTSGVNVHFKAMNKALRLKTTLTNACGIAEQYYCFHSTNIACPYDGPSLMSNCKSYDVSVNSATKQVQIVKSNNNCDDEIASMKIKTTNSG